MRPRRWRSTSWLWTPIPTRVLLQDGLADLYFKIGRIKDAVSAAQDQVKKNPDDVDAHTLLGQVYLRSLGDMQGTQAGEMLQLAITEYETIARLKPNDIETKLLLGQLYALNHDSAKAEAEFKAAQTDRRQLRGGGAAGWRACTARRAMRSARSTRSTAVPVDDRTARIEFALAAELRPVEEAEAGSRGLSPLAGYRTGQPRRASAVWPAPCWPTISWMRR